MNSATSSPPRSFGMRVDRFSIGFPPRAFGKQIGETDYCVSWIPIGGYVKIAGMIDESFDTEYLDHAPRTVGIPREADLAADDRDFRRASS